MTFKIREKAFIDCLLCPSSLRAFSEFPNFIKHIWELCVMKLWTVNNFPNSTGVAWIWIRISLILELDLPTNPYKSDTIIIQEKERETSQ